MINPEQMQDKTDQELVALTLENQGNFLYLLKRYEDKLKRYILRISNVSGEEAEDILQDTFIKVYQNLNDFDPSLKFSSWIYRITHNEVISHHRRRQARPEGYRMEISEELANKLAADLDTEREIDLGLLRDNLEAALLNIDEKYREVIILKFFEGLDYREISDVLKKPVGTIGTLINRAKNKLREEIGEKISVA
ncbi:MAG: RNA polymerase sigma factor [Candidatus Falkowbacteria bacterium]